MIKNFVSRHTPVARPRACAVARPCAQVGCVVCLAGRVAPGHARLCPAMSRYNLLYRVPAPKLGSNPFQLHCNFFFHSFFFLCSSYCKTTKFIYLIFFFKSFSRTSKTYLFIFPVLHNVKLREKNFPSTFFPICYSPSIQFHTTYNTQSSNNHQNAQRMHDLTRFPSSPMYSYT